MFSLSPKKLSIETTIVFGQKIIQALPDSSLIAHDRELFVLHYKKYRPYEGILLTAQDSVLVVCLFVAVAMTCTNR